jgi:hypothetical protein
LRDPSTPTPHVRIGLAALSSLADATDLVLVKEFIEARVPAVRRAALAAWLMLRPGDKDLIALEALRDRATMVRRFSSYVIQRKGAFVPFDVIRSNLERQEDWSLLLSLSQMNKWDWLVTIVRSVAHIGTNGLQEGRVRSSLHSWRSGAARGYALPSAEQIEFLNSAPAQLALCRLTGDSTMPVPFLEFALRGG